MFLNERYSFNPYKKKYKGNWSYRCCYCKEVIKVPKEPTDGGYYMWDMLDDEIKEYILSMVCSESCIKEIEQIYIKRKGLAV